MTTYKIQNPRSLRNEMKDVARGERPAPADAAKPSFNSVEAVVRLLTPENRELLAIIRDRKPQSVAELVQMSGSSPGEPCENLWGRLPGTRIGRR